MSRRTLRHALLNLFLPARRRRRALQTAHRPGIGGAKDCLPISGASDAQWSTAIQLSLRPHEVPTFPAALAVRLSLTCGYAGVGWHDADGVAEEISVGPGPCTRTVHLTLWNPGLCRSLIVRSVRRAPLAATLESLDWLPLRETLTSPRWLASLGELPDDCFLDLPFKGCLTEAIWRAGREGRWRDPDLRLRRLKQMVSLAWRHCPGYRAWWSQHGWHPSDLRSLEDADAIPAITKEQIRADLDAFSLPRRTAMVASTSGSTGRPFSFRYTTALRAAHHAQAALGCSWAIADLPPWQARLATLSARAVRGISATGSAGSLVLSHAALRQPEALLDLMQSYAPMWLFTIPSSAAKLANVLGGKFRFRGALISSETILPSQTRATEQIADTVIATYGLSEGAAFALRCPSCGTYCELPSHGVTTLRRRPDGLFDIVGTGFWSLGTLFIAYATGDLTAGHAEPCAACTMGGLTLLDVVGRDQDALVDCDGASYTIALLYRVLYPDMPRVKLYDFLQAEPGRATMRYVTHDGSPLEHGRIERSLRHVVPTLAIDLQATPDLEAIRDERPPSTKWRLVKTTGELACPTIARPEIPVQ